MDLLAIPNYYIKKGRPRAPLREEAKGQRILHRPFTQEEVQKKYYLGIHDRFIRDEKFRKNMIDNGRTEEICRPGGQLKDKEDAAHNN